MSAPTPPKDYSEARERIPRSDRRSAFEREVNGSPNVFADETGDKDTGKAGPVAVSLSDLKRTPANDPNELLRDRFLCRGGGLLIVGPSGIGKSSFVMQCALCWSIGRAAFGITPARPLKILIVQAENDDGDMAEMRDGVLAGLGFTEEEKKRACDNVFVCRDDEHAGAAFFAHTVVPLLEKLKPDLQIIDPAHAYHGGDSSAQKDVSTFLRQQLNPVIRKHDCGVVVVHHTNKPPTGREKSSWSGSDFAYLGSGSAEWTNWSRAVLAIRQLSGGVFELIAPKRGRRLRWLEEDGESPTLSKFIRHHPAPGIICWEEVPTDEVPPPQSARGSKPSASPEDLLKLISPSKRYRKDTLISIAKRNGISRDDCRGLISILLDDGELFEHHTPRKGAKSAITYARYKPSNEERVAP